MSAAGKLEDPRAEEAIDWMVELSEAPSSRDQTRFEAWLRADPANERAWVHLMESLMPFCVAARQRLPQGALTKGLLRKHSRRVFVATLAGLCGGGALGLAATDRFIPLRGVFADHFTMTAQQKSVILGDGSELLLAPRTAVDVPRQQATRSFRLLEGKVMARVKESASPFQVIIDDVTLRAGEGTFLVEQRDGVVTLASIERSASIEGRGSTPYAIDRGQQLILADGRVERVPIDVEMATAWVDGLLVVRDQSLASVIAAIRPYFPGVIRVDPAAAPLHVTGVFSLKDPSAALDSLAEALGLSIERVAQYWVSLQTRQI